MFAGSSRGTKSLFLFLSPSPLKERGIKVEDSSRGEADKTSNKV